MANATIKSARRVIEIMEFFDRKRRPIGLKEICDGLGYPVSSGAAMLKSLMLLGYLEYDKASRTYLPTMRIAVLGRWVADQLFSEARMLPLMEELRERTRETIILGTQSEIRAQYVHVLRSPQPLSYSAEPGSLRPLTRSGVGLVLLSTKSDPEIDTLVYRSNYDEPNRSRRVALKDVMEKVSGIRKQGYFFSRHLYTEGVGVIAMPLPAAPYNRTFVVALGGPVRRLEKNLAANLTAMRKAIRTLLPPQIT
ncbi:IclR family transcriptional regulator [Bradyrhizobium ivorense]|uniref:IclR family transcriptional regulator n=1 Tax=Bradyrhizobium ivorense TaxID=2511166 RepID=UPI0010B7B590|nr:IclR family transcriptional regulator [Bradyrhizobium ivorense]MCC8934964.1 IclR family transcriptional regulator [Bradyrhizobium ivorense]VIO67253.1 Transcriptional regulator KdgR [Bradyrhizobium ivorense]